MVARKASVHKTVGKAAATAKKTTARTKAKTVVAKVQKMEPHYTFYIAKVDAKKRIAVRGAKANYYAVTELEDGLILLKPQQETRLEDIPPEVLAMMDRAMVGLDAGIIAGPIELD
jgi:hypothetical protein